MSDFKIKVSGTYIPFLNIGPKFDKTNLDGKLGRDGYITKEDFRPVIEDFLLTRKSRNDRLYDNPYYDYINDFQQYYFENVLKKQIVTFTNIDSFDSESNDLEKIRKVIESVIKEEHSKEQQCYPPYAGNSYGCKK